MVALYAATHHYISNIDITFESASEARSECYLQAWHRPADGGDDFTLFAQYHDCWTKTEDGWRIRERRLKTAGSIGGDISGLEMLGRAN